VDLDRACSDADKTGNPRLQSESRAARARLRLERGDGGGSLADSRWALEGWLRLEGRLGEEGSQGFRETARVVSDLGLRACAAGLKDERTRLPPEAASEAAYFAEGGRAMALAESLSNRQRMLAASVSAEAVEQERTARRLLTEVRAKLLRIASAPSPDSVAGEAARRELAEAESALRESRARLQRESRRGASIAFPSPRPLAEILAAVGPRAALVHYQADAEDGRLRVLVLKEEGAWIRDLGPSAGILEGAEGWLRAASTEGADEDGAARSLYDALLRPLESLLAGKERLLLSPDGRLSFLPFEALLRAEGGIEERAIERWEIALIPSGSVLVELREDARGNPSGEGAVVLGDPVYASEAPAAARAPAPGPAKDPLRFGSLERLPGTGEEAKAVAARFPAARTTLLLRGDATRARLQETLAGAGGRLAAVHLACHGRIDPDHPALSGLALGAGEILDLHDLSSMRLAADLVVLSACDTGRGPVAVGEGVMGFVRAVFFAGSPRVVVSNWKVPDEGTRILMDRFYEGLRVRRLPAGAALREAKRAFLAERGARSHPYHWAGFVLWGLPD
jgi:CHAT domain-containing protein